MTMLSTSSSLSFSVVTLVKFEDDDFEISEESKAVNSVSFLSFFIAGNHELFNAEKVTNSMKNVTGRTHFSFLFHLRKAILDHN